MLIRPRLSDWRRESLRTTLWFVPTVEVVLAVALFAGSYAVDQAAYRGDVTLPSWVNSGSADAARQIPTAIAAVVIAVVGLVFSITIVALTLASTQFGPRILRNFIRDRGTQVTLGTFVSTFVYAVLALGSVSHGRRGNFVPHTSITVALALVLADLGVLIFFIHHVAKSIQLPEVIASIARNLGGAIEAEVVSRNEMRSPSGHEAGSSPSDLLLRMEEPGAVVAATRSGYLQFVRYDTLVDIAAAADAVTRLLYRPGHFVVEGLPMATVWPAEAASGVARGLERAHVIGPTALSRRTSALRSTNSSKSPSRRCRPPSTFQTVGGLARTPRRRCSGRPQARAVVRVLGPHCYPADPPAVPSWS